MGSHTLPIIQTLPVPKGDDVWEAKRTAILADFNRKVPKEYHIPQKYIDDPPLNVTRIPRESGILLPAELDITENYDAVGLANAIAIRRYSALAVATAFLKRAIICHQISCCLTQWFPELALEQARQLDEHLARTGKTVGPLHGVPVSIKQHIPIANTSSDMGLVSTIVHDESDALMVSILRQLGAVFYVKTNQPQSLMHLESDSHLGRVLNPYNIHLSAGGSTGGEAALIALRGSVMGVGTDIGGSVRGPAGKVGIYGFKPTAYTLPMRDFIRGGFPGELNILGSAGPLCRSVRDMDFFMREVLGREPHLADPRLVPIPWSGSKTTIPVNTSSPLKVGIMLNDGVLQPQPPVLRALQWAKGLLETISVVQLKDYKPYRAADAMNMIRKMYWPDGGQALKKEAATVGEPLHVLTEWIIKDAGGHQKNALEITEDRVQRDAFRCAFAEDWTAQDVDVVLCPVYVGPAPAHDTSLYWNYTALWNFVDYSGVVFPTPIKAKKRGEESYPDTAAWNDQDAYIRKLWAEKDYDGAPIALQLVARKHFDNWLFGALEILKMPLGLD